MQTAQLTGMLDGSPTWQRIVQEAQLTGDYNGSPTWQKVFQESGLTGYYNGQKTLDREQAENQTALGYLGLQLQARGPRNAFKYAELLNGTPEGLKSVLSAAHGNYQLAGMGGTNPNATAQPMTLQTMWQDALGPGYNPYAQSAPTPATAPNPSGTPAQNTMAPNTQPVGSVSPSGVQAPADWYNYEPTTAGATNVYPPGVQAPLESQQYSTQVPRNRQPSTGQPVECPQHQQHEPLQHGSAARRLRERGLRSGFGDGNLQTVSP